MNRIGLVLAAALLTHLAPAQQKRDFSKGNTLYVVPYAHLDTQWRWAYPQVIREYIANTLHDNFRLIERYPNYVFNFSGSRRYEMMKEYYPAEYARLKGYIRAGRWFPCGSSVDENDANVPSGESFIRHVLYGNRFFQREFGVTSQEFMLPDCFGFPYALPSLLAHCGIRGFSTQKLTWGSAVGIPFKVGRWEGPDGRSVVAALDPGSYGADITEDLSQNTSWLARIQNTGRLSGAYVDYHYYGTGDIGGAPRENAVQWVERSIAGAGPIKVVSTRADEMFGSFTPQQVRKLPHYKGELLLTEHSAGSITSQAYMKRWNRKSELLADASERASVAAMWLGGAPYPSKRLYDAWDLVLGSQMHDMLPGTSIPKAYEFCWNDYLLALNQFSAVTTDALGVVASVMDTRGTGTPLVVYNPLSIERDEVVEAKVPGYTEPLQPMQVAGPDGRPAPTQTVRADAEATTILFRAKVPANGFAVFHARSSGGTQRLGPGLRVSAGQTPTLENQSLRVRLNRDGDIASVFDKRLNREILKSPSRLEFQYHNPRAFPAWNMDWDDARKPPAAVVSGPAKVRIVEQGPVRVALEVERRAMGSTFVQTIRLAAGADQVDVHNRIDWQTKEMALKASFPLTSANKVATYDLQLGAIERGNNNPKHYEVPQHQWLDLSRSDGGYGVGILNDSKYGSDKPSDDTVRLTLVYTPGVRGGYRDQSTQDIGRHEVLYAIAPHKGDWRGGGVPWAAKRLNQPMRAFTAARHAGALGRSFSLASVSSARVEIQAIKKAEDSDEIVVRLRELTGRHVPGARLTFAVPVAAAREVTGQEHEIGPARIVSGSVVVDMPAFGLKTFALKLSPPRVKAPAPVSRFVELPFDLDVASSDRNRADGAMDDAGRSYAAEQLPSEIRLGGVRFRLGSTRDGARNALRALGQRVAIPAGTNRLCVLAAAHGGRGRGQFGIGNTVQPVTVPNWNGYVGQWDNRLWDTDPGPNFTRYGEMAGLVRGWVNPTEVAWYASHRHTPTGNTFYEYSYLYLFKLDVPSGATSVRLPTNQNIRVFALTAVRGPLDEAQPAGSLVDTLRYSVADEGPSISPAGGTITDATTVSIRPPLYWQGNMRYTVDGSVPSSQSPIYRSPFITHEGVTIRAAQIAEDGSRGPVSSVTLTGRDTRAPRVVSAVALKQLGLARVTFSEPVAAVSALAPSSYRFGSGAQVNAAKLRPDGRTVELTLDRALPIGREETLTIEGVEDASPARNALRNVAVKLVERGEVFASPALEPATSRTFQASALPVGAKDAWTLNLFCKVDQKPEDRTIIAGFGRALDGRTGTGRYFAKFPRGINFWAANRDVMTTVPLELGKWQMLTATYDGETLRIFKNAELIGERQVELANDQAQVQVMPLDAWERRRRFGGEVRNLTIWDQDLPPDAIRRIYESGR